MSDRIDLFSFSNGLSAWCPYILAQDDSLCPGKVSIVILTYELKDDSLEHLFKSSYKTLRNYILDSASNLSTKHFAIVLLDSATIRHHPKADRNRKGWEQKMTSLDSCWIQI